MRGIAFLFAVLAFTAAAQEKPVSPETLAEWGNELMHRDGFGPFRLKMTAGQVKKISHCEFHYGKQEEEGATGLYITDWTSSDCGITLTMGSSEPQGTQTIQRMKLESNSPLLTQRHIGIGSSMADVTAAYGRERDVSSSDDLFVAGSLYGGMVFGFTNGKVSSVFLGAAAE